MEVNDADKAPADAERPNTGRSPDNEPGDRAASTRRSQWDAHFAAQAEKDRRLAASNFRAAFEEWAAWAPDVARPGPRASVIIMEPHELVVLADELECDVLEEVIGDAHRRGYGASRIAAPTFGSAYTGRVRFVDKALERGHQARLRDAIPSPPRLDWLAALDRREWGVNPLRDILRVWASACVTGRLVIRNIPLGIARRFLVDDRVAAFRRAGYRAMTKPPESGTPESRHADPGNPTCDLIFAAPGAGATGVVTYDYAALS